MPKFDPATVDTDDLDLTEYDAQLVPDQGEHSDHEQQPEGFIPDEDYLEPGYSPDASREPV